MGSLVFDITDFSFISTIKISLDHKVSFVIHVNIKKINKKKESFTGRNFFFEKIWKATDCFVE